MPQKSETQFNRKYRLKYILPVLMVGFLGLFVLGMNGAEAATYEGTFPSRVFDNFHSSVDYGVMNWNVDATPAGTSLVFSVRAGNVSTPDGTWTDWSVISNSGDSLDAYDGMMYMQYSVVLGTDDLSVFPTVYDVSMTKNTTALTSSVFDSEDSQNIINGISWDETLDGFSDAVFQMRTSADNSTWSDWCGPDNDGAGCDMESWFSDPVGGETIDAMFSDQADDRYFQYRAILISDTVGGTEWPTVDNVNVDYELPDTATRTDEQTYTSAIKDMGNFQEYMAIDWTADVPPNTSLTVKARTDSVSDMSGAPDWSTCDLVSDGEDISANNCVTDGDQYLEYQIVFGMDSLDKFPTLYDINIQTLQPGSLTSSPYNSTDTANALGGVSWRENETLPADSQVKVYLRSTGTLADPISSTVWDTDWQEIASSTPTSLTTGCEKVGQDITCDDTTIPAEMLDATNDQYFQYKVELTSAGATAPTVEQTEIIYVVNGSPELQNVQASPDASGNVNIIYETRDLDTTAGSNTPNEVTPSFEYSLNSGSTWNTTTTECFQTEDLTNKAVQEVNFIEYSATWDPSCETSIGTTTFSDQAQIKVIVDDNEAANSTAEADSPDFTLDTTPPVLTDVDLNASTNPAEITITSTDDSTY
ncbi:MAG: hypothetical protein PF549_04750, partial [Patescibacteria group bacterium]|nr:hypothetical protein [Patescibacteria group bacterium]